MRKLSPQQLPHGHAERPHVRLEREDFLGEALWRHVPHRQPAHAVQLPELLAILQIPGLPKVTELDGVLFAQQHVADGKITMQNTFLGNDVRLRCG